MEEFKEALQGCDTVKVILTGVGEKQFNTKGIFEKIEELERLAGIGIATEKLFKEKKVDILVNPEWCHGELEQMGAAINSLEQLLEWADKL